LNKAYDTYGNAGAVAGMYKDLSKIPNGSIIAVGVKDEASRRLSR